MTQRKTGRSIEGILHQSSRRAVLLGLLVMAVALLARVWRLLELRRDILWDHLVGDARIHQLLGLEIAGRDFWGHEPFYRAPFYPYFLGIVFKLFGPSLLSPRLIQILLGTASCLLVYLIGRRIFRPGVGLAAGLFCALNAVMVQYDMEMEISSLIVFLNLLGLWIIARRDRPSRRSGFAAGIALGLSAITRPDVILFALLLVGWLFVSLGKDRAARQASLAVLLGVFLPVAGVTMRNYIVGGEPIVVSSQGGVNFFIGNNPQADGRTWFQPVEMSRADYHKYEREAGGSIWAKDNIWLVSRFGAERAMKRNLSPGQVSSYWYGQGIRFITGRPAASIRLLLRKTYYLLNGWEVHSGLDLYAMKKSSTFLRSVLWLGWGLLVPLALAGLVISRSRSGPALLLLLYLAAYAVAILLFFVNDRFRIPMIPILALFAAQGAWSAREAARGRKLGSLALYGTVLVTAAIVANSSWAGVRGMKVTIPTHNQLGDLYRADGKLDRAIEEYSTSLRYGPNYAETLQNLGVAYVESNRPEKAEQALSRAIELDPAYALAYANLGWLRETQRRDAEAIDTYRKALSIDPSLRLARRRLATALLRLGESGEALTLYALPQQEGVEDVPVLSQLARTALVAGDYDQARRFLERAVRITPDDARLHHNLGIVCDHLGDTEAAISEFRRAIEIVPGEIPPRLRLAGLYERLGRDSLALRGYDEAVARDPALPDAWLGRARIYLRLGLKDKAREDLDWVLAKAPDNAEALALRNGL